MKKPMKRAIESGDTRVTSRGVSTGRIAGAITVTTCGGKAILTGTVRSWQERCTAEHAAWASPDICEIDDRLVVVPNEKA